VGALEDNVLVIPHTHMRSALKAKEVHPETAICPRYLILSTIFHLALKEPAHTDNGPANGVSSTVCPRLLFVQI
jgi:hypothetical protein